jgi:hypothetical protein
MTLSITNDDEILKRPADEEMKKSLLPEFNDVGINKKWNKYYTFYTFIFTLLTSKLINSIFEGMRKKPGS